MNRIAKLDPPQTRLFALRFGELLRDELTDTQAMMLGLFVENRDNAEAGRLLREFLKPHIDAVLEDMAELNTDYAEGPVCSTGYDSQDGESARLDRRDRARACK